MRPSEHATFEEFHAALEATWRETWARAYALRDECERCATRLSTSSPSPPHSPGPSDAADPLHTTPPTRRGGRVAPYLAAGGRNSAASRLGKTPASKEMM